ncbi:hypothetical protein TNCV_1491641 [Trichonephila clavipes]|nr:hypothetical protein TNCV_1491641 [Trichonephila clavipes]
MIVGSICHRIVDANRFHEKESVPLIVQKISRKKRPISDMQFHGVGRHHDQWPHVPTCGCEWDYDGQRYIDEVLLPHVRLFRGAVGDKFVFYG